MSSRNKTALILKPILDRCLIEFLEDPLAPAGENMVGGLVMPEGFEAKPQGLTKPEHIARVVACGPECKSLHVGDLIVIPFSRAEGFSVRGHEEQTFWQIVEKAAIAVLPA